MNGSGQRQLWTTCLVPLLLTGLCPALTLFYIDGVGGSHCVELVIRVPAGQTTGQGDKAEEQQRCNEGSHPD